MITLPTGFNIPKAPEIKAEPVKAVTETVISNTPKQRKDDYKEKVVKPSRPHPAPGQLSPKETDVLRLLKIGLTPKEIASTLKITEKTVKFHKTNIYKKENVKGIAQLLTKHLGSNKTEGAI